jgi:hypothetical protein
MPTNDRTCTPTRISYTVSAMEIVWRLLWNTDITHTALKMGPFTQQVRNVNGHIVNNVLFWQQSNKTQVRAHDISKITDVALTQVRRSLHDDVPSVSPSGYNTFSLEMTPNADNFVNGCNKSYKFCPIFRSRVTLNLARMYYQHKDDSQWYNKWQDACSKTVCILTLCCNNLQTSGLLWIIKLMTMKASFERNFVQCCTKLVHSSYPNNGVKRHNTLLDVFLTPSDL